jgi:hypothetical protein
VPDALKQPLLVGADEHNCVVRGRRPTDAICSALQHNGRHGDIRLLRELVFDWLVLRIALDSPEPMPIRVDDDVHEVRIVLPRRWLGEEA